VAPTGFIGGGAPRLLFWITVLAITFSLVTATVLLLGETPEIGWLGAAVILAVVWSVDIALRIGIRQRRARSR
jgi:hypothetical protein